MEEERWLSMGDYEAAIARWCPGCGDHAVLTAMERLLEAEQLPPERTVFVSGIGCSSRFPHYVKTYGFHGLHGRALPVATGIKVRRPDLHVFVVMGDGDCCSIGAGHWIHTVRYNPDMVAIMLDNGVYGLTKNQTSPTTPKGHRSYTQPRGAYLPGLNPVATTLGVTNASFVAQTGDWLPDHLYETFKAAYHHHGFAFIRVLQRCPMYTDDLFAEAVRDPNRVELLLHPDGIKVPDLEQIYKKHVRHDPSDLANAHRLAQEDGMVRLGLFYRSQSVPVYEDVRTVPLRTAEEKIEILNEELDRYAV
ncbi:MAG: 2-oxoglutarate oxidoreductase [Gemmatimonadales bacterium]|nr:2-oxoglutarate oxidoreductase [Gemmatimonadales bacterium]NIN10912.1 2-oxoglutarate oxidoreductase [Gemmatimonadales bacterium]NIN49510.1 2-oxoglutarate oxidoreductase [Gemmatimonadales bacterium]NIP06974.1 2-oxoglutarate oxidoreductase [Gemmatimonadales bacterium]NIQ99034.1 2-oxoglutarate oxidoreductase [Gemmatimonadales bacterium]